MLKHEGVQEVEGLLLELDRLTEALQERLLESAHKASPASELEELAFEIAAAFDELRAGRHGVRSPDGWVRPPAFRPGYRGPAGTIALARRRDGCTRLRSLIMRGRADAIEESAAQVQDGAGTEFAPAHACAFHALLDEMVGRGLDG